MARRMTPAEILIEYAPAVACVEVVDEKTGDEGVGTAFHIGGGLYVTAAHVFEGKAVGSLSTMLPTTRAEKDGWRGPLYAPRSIAGDELVLHRHPDPSVDVAVITSTLQAAVIPLGLDLEASMNETYLVLEPVIVMGFPQIPCVPTSLICSRGEINACLRPYVGSTRPHFIISPMARGGFSGGPAPLAETGECIGVVTQSFVADDKPAEHGYFAEYAQRLHDEREAGSPASTRPPTFFVVGIHLDRGRVGHGGMQDRDEAISRARAMALEHAGGRWTFFFVESNQRTNRDEVVAQFSVPDAGYLAHPRREPE